MSSHQTDYSDQSDRVESARQAHIAALEEELRRKERRIDELEKQLGSDAPDPNRDRRGYGGTPNLSGDIERKLAEGPPSDEAFQQMPHEYKTLNEALRDGPEAFVNEKTPVYPVHERAHDILVMAASLARTESEDGSTLFLTAPTVKRFLEARGDEKLKHTQVRRAFETIEQAGKDYPRPPTLHKNRDEVVELVLFDYPSLFDQTMLM